MRRSSRTSVHLKVRYEKAHEYVVEYADNLSAGGLFLAGAVHLEALAHVNVEIELPGFGSFRVKAQVAHVLTEELAKSLGRAPGAGLAIVRAPEGFEQATRRYLELLGQRADRLVLVGHSGIARIIGDAGYRVEMVPAADALVAFIARADEHVIGVVVAPEDLEAYVASASVAGAGDLVMAMKGKSEVDSVLSKLDESV